MGSTDTEGRDKRDGCSVETARGATHRVQPCRALIPSDDAAKEVALAVPPHLDRLPHDALCAHIDAD